MRILKHYYKGEIKTTSFNKYRTLYKFLFINNGNYRSLTFDTREEAIEHQKNYSLITGYVIRTDDKVLPYSFYQKYNEAVFKKDFLTYKQAEDYLSLIS